jgi:hypothetical protein
MTQIRLYVLRNMEILFCVFSYPCKSLHQKHILHMNYT